MTTSCDNVRELIAAEGAAALAQGSEAEAHVTECEACCAFVEALARVDRELASLQPINPPDASIAKVIAAIEHAATTNGAVPGTIAPVVAIEAKKPKRRWLRTAVMAGGIAAGFAFVVIAAGTTMFMRAGGPSRMIAMKSEPRGADVVVDGRFADREQAQKMDEWRGRALMQEQANKAQADAMEAEKFKAERAASETRKEESKRLENQAGKDSNQNGDDENMPVNLAPATTTPKPPPPATPVEQPPPEKPVVLAQLAEKRPEGLKTPPPMPVSGNERAPETSEDGDKSGAVDSTTKVVDKLDLPPDVVAGKHRIHVEKPGYFAYEQTIAVEDQTRARSFFDARSSLEGLAFQDAHGYWSNTYVPGDASLRMLAARMIEHRAQGLAIAGLDELAAPPAQPFDAPKRTALALNVHADHARVEGPARVLVQVGLKGAPVHGRRRPSMNVGLVVDASGDLSIEEAKSIRSIAAAFAAQRAPGDRFSITVAGRPGAMIVTPEQFRAGTVAAAMEALFAEKTAAAANDRRPALKLTEAMELAIGNVADSGDDTAPLGASEVILVTPSPIGADTARVQRIAHTSAVAGIPVGVFSAGTRAVEAELQQIALHGQGARRVVGTASEAAPAVERELAAVGRAVARAVRLDIRLSPKAKLVGVIGSERLDAQETRRVKQAEESIDRRLSKSLGIAADRGRDDAGIQILIPSFYADDAHVVLLDVVVDGPGPVVEVSAKYKDLVQLANGTASAKLELARGSAEPGPLEANVLANLVSYEVSKKLERAADAVRAGDVYRAKAELDGASALVAELGRKTREQDRGLAIDQKMIAGYAKLAVVAANDAGRRNYLADSLAYAAMLERLPRPKE